jgi:hypothetical protein
MRMGEYKVIMKCVLTLALTCLSNLEAQVDTTMCISGNWTTYKHGSQLCLNINGRSIKDSLSFQYFVMDTQFKYPLLRFGYPIIERNDIWKGETPSLDSCNSQEICRWKFFTSDWKTLSGRKKDWIKKGLLPSLIENATIQHDSGSCDKKCEKKMRKDALDVISSNKSKYIVLFRHPNEPRGPFIYIETKNKFYEFNVDW